MDDIVNGRINGQDLKELQNSSSATLHEPSTFDQVPDLLPSKLSGDTSVAIRDSREPIKCVKPGGKIDYSGWDRLKEEEEELPQQMPLAVTQQDTESKTSSTPRRAATISPSEKETLQLIENLKKKGKTAFSNEDFNGAIGFYTLAIDSCLQPENRAKDAFSFLEKFVKSQSIRVPHTLYLNRALCYYRIGDFEKGLNDCNLALVAGSPSDVKTLYRKYQCLRGLRNFKGAKKILEECLALTESSKENQQLVSLTVLQSCLRQVALLVEDEDRTTDLMIQPSPIQLEVRQIMERMISNDVNTRIAAHRQITIIFATMPESLHLFRTLDGFRLITAAGQCNTPTISWAMLLASACEGTPENMRALSEYITPFIDMLSTALDFGNKESALVLDSMLQMVLKNEYLRLAVETLGPSCSKKFQSILLMCVKEKTILSTELKSLLLSWLCSNLKESRLKFIAKIADSLLLSEAAQMAMRALSSGDQPLLAKEAVSFLFYLGLDNKASAKTCLHGLGAQIFESLVEFVLKNASSQNIIYEPLVSDALSTIYNGLLINSNLDEASVDLSFITFLCNYGNNRSNSIAIKILAKFCRPEYKDVTSTIAEKIDWSKGLELLHSSEMPALDVELAGDWSQILAGVLKSDPRMYCVKLERVLSILIILMTKIVLSKTSIRVIGNTTLCLLEFASIESYRERMIDEGLMKAVILHLRSSSSVSFSTNPAKKSYQRNLAICCAKLCQSTRGREIARAMDAIPLIYSLNAI